MRALILAAFCAGLPLAAAAQTYQAVNLLYVFPVAGGDFEVVEDHGEGPRGMWCAAASYAQDRLGASGSARLYVKTARGPSVSVSGKSGAVFTLDEASLTVPPTRSYSVSVRTPGLNLPVGHAVEFCKDFILELQGL
ncbi:hypothetical protein [Roseobacter sp. GAI101]|uniref:hypothetical protein n=1 Tax=Roseobacter sp. (strain GAI101) TaxID=391589 RepID=UPI00018723A1|nr:hypothetical protein [Roseobacter sp. GAI101]EEB86256.1 conserved hypothetical protein [Roseobacter sp. GAI101]